MPDRAAGVPGKRAFDVVVAGCALVVLAPLLAVIWCVVKATSRGPAVYRGARVGLHGQPFEIFKFRSMYVGSSTQLTTALNDARITRVGRVLRRYKLDELPQLVNVLGGEMSLVGPRPEFQQWVDLYSPQEMRILTVRPGITDLASIEFIELDRHVGEEHADARYLEVAFHRKNQLRLKYVDEMSWHTDLSILKRTLARLVSSDEP